MTSEVLENRLAESIMLVRKHARTHGAYMHAVRVCMHLGNAIVLREHSTHIPREASFETMLSMMMHTLLACYILACLGVMNLQVQLWLVHLQVYAPSTAVCDQEGYSF